MGKRKRRINRADLIPKVKDVRAYRRSGYTRRTKTGKVVHVRPHHVKEHRQRYWVAKPVTLEEARRIFAQRSKRAQAADLAKRATATLSPGLPISGRWRLHPEKYDLAGVDTPARRKEMKAEVEKRRKIDRGLQLEMKIRAGRVRYEDVPDENPFKYHSGDYLTKVERLENERWRLVRPYISAKRDTDETIKIMEDLGMKPDRERIFQDYVKYHTGEIEEDPYKAVWERWGRAEKIEPVLENALDRELAKNGGQATEEDVLREFSGEERELARTILRRWARRGSIEIRRGVIKPKGKVVYSKPKPSTRAVQALKRLLFFEQDKNPNVVVKDGKIRVRFVDPSYTQMFDGELDARDLPLPEGKWRLRDLGGDLIALVHPSVIKRVGNKLVFLKFDVKKRNRWTGETFKTAKRYELALEPAEEVKEPKTPKFRTDVRFRITGKVLKWFLRPTEAYDDHFVRIKATPDGLVLRRNLSWEGENMLELAKLIREGKGDRQDEEDLKKWLKKQKVTVEDLKPLELRSGKAKGLTYEARPSGEREGVYEFAPLREFATLLSDKAVVTIEFGEEKDKHSGKTHTTPIKVTVSGDPHVQGTFWLVSRLEV